VPINLYLYRSGQTNPFKKCENDNIDSCYLSNAEVQKDETILIITECQSNCEFKFRTYWSNV
jgi:hypothetical protein